MRTTIIIDEHILGELMQSSKAKSHSKAVRTAVEDYLKRKRQEGFMRLAGSNLCNLEWREAEEQEMREHEQTHR